MPLRALIFDVDGTLAETEELHRQSFNESFAAAGLPWDWDQALYAKLLEVTGGKERIGHYIEAHGGAVAADKRAGEPRGPAGLPRRQRADLGGCGVLQPGGRPEAGDAATLLVHHDDGVGERGADVGGEVGELFGVFDVAGEQDDAGGGVPAEQVLLVEREDGAGYAEDGGFH